MKTVALIPARGGSKGVQNKNIRLLNDEPLIFYSITAAKYSNVDEVWVSTDSGAIKSAALNVGAKVIDRPVELASDTSRSEDALLHFCDNVEFDRLVFLQATSPLIQPDHINGGLEMMDEYDSVFSAYKEHWLPRWTMDVNPHNFHSVSSRGMRQDYNDVWVENGAFYITSRDQLLESKNRVSGNIGVYEMKPHQSVQIDTEHDFEFCEKLL